MTCGADFTPSRKRDGPARVLGNFRGYLQADACATGLDAGGYDLFTSTMLLHELPTTHLAELFVQAHRLLEPGGWTVHLDFLPQVQPGADGFSHFIHAGHAVRNNEPFMQTLAAFAIRELYNKKAATAKLAANKVAAAASA